MMCTFRDFPPYEPEGISVLVITPDERIALQAGPMLAQRQHPDRRIGAILHAEWKHVGWEVVVQDLGPV